MLKTDEIYKKIAENKPIYTLDEYVDKKVSKNLSKLGYNLSTPFKDNSMVGVFFGKNASIGYQFSTEDQKDVLYLLFVLNSINTSSSSIQSIIIVPSNERAKEIYEKLIILIGKMEINTYLCINTNSIISDKNISKNNCHLVVGTPSHLDFNIKRRYIPVFMIKNLIIDNFDEFNYKDMDFLENIMILLPSSIERKIFYDELKEIEKSKNFFIKKFLS